MLSLILVFFILLNGNKTPNLFYTKTPINSIFNGLISHLNLTAHTQKLADPGETISDKPMYLNSLCGPTDYDIFGIMEPMSIKVSFIGSDGRIHSGKIDCQSK